MDKHGFRFKPSAPQAVLDEKFQDFAKSYKGSYTDRLGREIKTDVHRAFDCLYNQGLLDGKQAGNPKSSGKKAGEGSLFSGKRSGKAESKVHTDKPRETEKQPESSSDGAS